MAYSQSQHNLFGRQTINQYQQQRKMVQQPQNHQRTYSMPSMQALMAVHQQQWQEHLTSISPRNNSMSASPTNNVSPNHNNTNSMQLQHGNNSMMMSYGSSTNILTSNNNYNKINTMKRNNSSNNLISNNNNINSMKRNINNTNTVAVSSPNSNYQQQMHQRNNSSTNNYTMWQRQYQQQNANISHSAMNLHSNHYQQPQLQQNQSHQSHHRRHQSSQMKQQTKAQTKPSRNHQRNRFGSTGQLLGRNNVNNNALYSYNNNNKKHLIEEKLNDDIENEKDTDSDSQSDDNNVTFIPPLPQNNKEIEKFVKWQANRKGIDNQQVIDFQVQKRQNLVQKPNKNDTILYESWLNKKGKINKSLQKRYCKIYKNRKLKYFRAINDTISAGNIDLSHVFGINIYLPKNIRDKSLEVKLNKIEQKYLNIKIKLISLKGIINDFGFELVTNKRIWTFTCSDKHIFLKYINILKDLCFGKLLHFGYLTKMGLKRKNWKRRFFIIFDLNEMRYFQDDSLSVQKGMINLNKITKVVESKPNKYQYSNCIELYTDKRIWILAPKNSDDQKIWINAIKNRIKAKNIKNNDIQQENNLKPSIYKKSNNIK